MSGPILASLLIISTVFAACGTGRDAGGTAPVLLFSGAGTSPGDVAALEEVLRVNHLEYSAVNSSQLNGMGDSAMRRHGLLIIPGGNFIEIGNGLTAATNGNIRNAIHSGLNYLGICAGGFFAGHSGSYNALNLTSGVQFGFYAAEARGIRKGAVAISSPGAPAIEQYWEDGPQFTGWGAVAGRYPDGTPAIVEGGYGTGWVVLSGVHPEAPVGWRRGMSFVTPVSVDHAYAGMLIKAALSRSMMPHY